MRTIHILGILVLLAVALPAAPAYVGGVVTVCDEAHLLAALAGGGTVTFACSGTITLTAEIVIAADTTIDGSGQEVTISGNDAVRVFTVSSGFTLSLNELTVANGNADFGGGVANHGAVIVANSTFSGNRANSTFWPNGGGGIYNQGIATVTNSTFSGNSAQDEGGAINNYGDTLTVGNSTFSGNYTNCDYQCYGGGAISNYDSMLTVIDSDFEDNHAGGPAANGGGISNLAVYTLTVSNSTFSGNSAEFGGGISAYTVSVSNSTFSGNHALDGGGILASTVSVSNSTFSGNRASNVGGGIWCNTLTVSNTIVANSPTGNNCYGSITDGGGNLSFPDTTCPGINADPLLGPLQDNGGPTWTMALGEGSAAIDAADDAICAAPPVNNLDQRGFPRPWGTHCDIGAVEQIQEPSAVCVSALRVQSPPGTITPAMVAGLLLAALVAVGVQRRPRHIG